VAARSSWKGFLKLSLVSVPVRGFSAAASSGEIRLHQLHETCHSRIKYKKTCPVHGEVTQDEIVSGYEYAKGQYVVIDPKELASMRSESDRSITIDAVVPDCSVDPIYHTDKTYYLAPDGAVGQKPYALIQKALAEHELAAVARVVLHGREELVLVRSKGKALAMTSLKFNAEVLPVDVIEEELDTPELEREELQLTRTLLKAFEKKNFKFTEYKDTYVESLREFIEAKVEGKEIVSPPEREEPQVINLMDALKKSVAQAGKGDSGESKTARKKQAASTRRRPAAKRRSG
jgi:DNA end-binding protein Ku